ncbi:SDR family oxidoreductase [Arthrobacter sp. OAP107]|uniref:SDR family oxidoreductase n=1 Tax=Arthrobacter sp. OAP107 TaxID=3156445 RepID=UPI003397A8D7
MATQDFSGKVAMVTGGGSGMGRSTALAFAAAGARTVVVDLSEESARATVDLIKEQGGEAIAVRCDVTRSEDVKAALEDTVATYGRLDAAFNNAGLEHGLIATAEISDAEFDRIVSVSLKGVFLSMKHQIPLMLANGGGAIVNNSSAAGLVGFKGQAAYTAAKHGMVGLTKAAALDYAPENVRINAICPGIVDTPMMDRVTGGTSDGRAAVITMEPIGRMGRPEEIAATVLWLCSDAASFVVGHALSVDGGMSTGHFGER